MTRTVTHDQMTPLLITGGVYKGHTARGELGLIPEDGSERCWVLWLDKDHPFRSGLFIARSLVQEIR